jgi:hypothetical protein
MLPAHWEPATSWRKPQQRLLCGLTSFAVVSPTTAKIGQRLGNLIVTVLHRVAALSRVDLSSWEIWRPAQSLPERAASFDRARNASRARIGYGMR